MDMPMDKPMMLGDPMSGLVASAMEYMVDAGQRSVLFLDVMRQRGDQYREAHRRDRSACPELRRELVIDGRTLERPVNYVAGAHHPAEGRRDRSQRAVRSSSSIRAPAMARASAASRPTAKSASR